MFVPPLFSYGLGVSCCVEMIQALLWTLTTVAILLSAGRFTIRYITASRFYWDDASHLLSLVLLIALAGTYTAGFPYSARIARIGLKKEPAPPLTDPFYHTYLQLRVVVTLLVFMVLWTVKATFLIFYRLLFEVSNTFIRVWWVAVAFSFASFWVCIGSTFTICGSAKDLYNFSMQLTCQVWIFPLMTCRKVQLASGSAQHPGYLQVLVCSERCVRRHRYVFLFPESLLRYADLHSHRIASFYALGSPAAQITKGRSCRDLLSWLRSRRLRHPSHSRVA